jgi:4-hydroxybutyryl-CoA dehydratase/vinylacetyl-CoA-Delta-isomerase
VSEIPVEDRIKIGRLSEAMTGGTAMVESMHGAGSPQAQRIMILREGNLAEKIKLAKALAEISRQRKKEEKASQCLPTTTRSHGCPPIPTGCRAN